MILLNSICLYGIDFCVNIKIKIFFAVCGCVPTNPTPDAAVSRLGVPFHCLCQGAEKPGTHMHAAYSKTPPPFYSLYE